MSARPLRAVREPNVRVLPSPAQPMAVARMFADDRCRHDGQLVVRHWRGQWWKWKRSHWTEIELRRIRHDLYEFTEHALYEEQNAKGETVIRKWAPNRHKILNLIEALGGITLLSQNVSQPTWLDERKQDGVIVACANGLLDVSTRTLLKHCPAYFNQTAVPFAYDPRADEPTRWMDFLDTLWKDEGDQIKALQEWFGYIISGRLDLHKILLLVGPTRGGKGAIARVLGALVGRSNVAGPTLSSLNGDFGLAPLIDKPLAVIADARLTGRDTSVVVERLLSISGEDTLTVNIKYKEQWSGKLPQAEGYAGYWLGGLTLFADDNIPNFGTSSNTQIIVTRPAEILQLEAAPVPYCFTASVAASAEAVLGLRQYVATVPRWKEGVSVITGAAYATSTFA